jgi:hypothetical protein
VVADERRFREKQQGGGGDERRRRHSGNSFPNSKKKCTEVKMTSLGTFPNEFVNLEMRQHLIEQFDFNASG